MDNQQFIEACLTKHGAYIDFPFGEDIAVVKVRNKMFAYALVLKGKETVTLACTAEMGIFYRGCYEGIVSRGWHCPPVQQPYFNTFVTATLDDDIVVGMIDHAYDRVLSKLAKFVRAELLSGDKE